MKDEAENESVRTRKITVGLGLFVFDPENSLQADWTLVDVTITPQDGGYLLETEGGSLSQKISGGTIAADIFPYGLLKVEIKAKASKDAKVKISLEGTTTSDSELNVTSEVQTFVKYFRFDAALVEKVLKIELPELENEYTVEELSLYFGLSQDTEPPQLNLPETEVHVVAGNEDLIKERLLKGVTAEDNIDGNLTKEVQVDLSKIDINQPGEYVVELSVSDSSGNKTIKERALSLYMAFETKIINDPTFDKPLDEDQWGMNVVTGLSDLYTENGVLVLATEKPGDWASADSPFLRGLNTDLLEVGNWYMFKFDVKAEKARQMRIRAGFELMGDPWIDDFSNTIPDEFLLQYKITTGWETIYHIFYVNEKEDTSNVIKFEVQLGTITWGGEEKDNKVYIDNAQFYLLGMVDTDPEITPVSGLRTTFVKDSEQPDWKTYITVNDLEDGVIEVTEEMVDASNVDFTKVGDYVVLFTVTDSAENEVSYSLNVKVLAEADTTKPVITLDETLPVEFDQFADVAVDFKDYITATDDLDGEITITDEMVNKAGFSLMKAGVYEVVFTVKDSSLNEATLTVEFTVNDKESPVIKGLSDKTIIVGEQFNPFAGITVIDNLDGEMELTLANISGLEEFLEASGMAIKEGVFEVVYEVEDSAGNKTVKAIEVTVLAVEFDEDEALDLLAMKLEIDNDGAAESTGEYLEDGTLKVEYHGVKGWYASYSKLKYVDLEISEDHLYKLVLEVKAESARDVLLYFVGKDNVAIGGFEGKRQIPITDEYVVLEYIFKPTMEGPYSMELHFGWEDNLNNASNSNVITIKQFKIVPEKEFVIEFDEDAALDLIALEIEVDNDGATEATAEYLEDGTLEVEYHGVKLWYASSAKLKYVDLDLSKEHLYKLVLEIKAESARDVLLYFVGKDNVAIEGFEGKRKISITDEYVVLEYLFVPEMEGPYNMELHFGWEDDLNNASDPNMISIKQFKIVPAKPQVEFDEDLALDLLALETEIDNDGAAESTGEYLADGTLKVEYHGVKGWYASYSKLKYVDLDLSKEHLYKLVLEVKAESARDVLLYFVGKDNVAIEGFEDKLLISLTEEYVVLEYLFVPEMEGPYNMELHFGWEGDLNNASDPNIISVKQFKIVPAKLPEPEIEFDEDLALDFIALETEVDNDGAVEATAEYLEDGTIKVEYQGAQGRYASYSKLKYVDLDLSKEHLYKLVLEVKAESARDVLLYFVGKDNVAIEGFEDKLLIPLTEEYVVLEYLFIPEIEGPYNMELHFGWESYLENASDPNIISIKQFKIVPEKVDMVYIEDAVISYDLWRDEGDYKSKTADFWEELFEHELLDSIAAVERLYDGNGSGGTYQEAPYLIKTGTASAKGVLKFKFNDNVLIKTVVLYIEGWSDSDKLIVNGVTKDLKVTKTYGERIVVELPAATNLVEIETDNRSFLFALEFYGPEADVREPENLAINFDYGYDDLVDAVTVEKDKRVFEPKNVKRVGYKFLGWFADVADENPFDFDLVITEAETFIAKWEVDPYTVLDSFFAEGKGGLAEMGWEEEGLGSDYDGYPMLKFDHAGDYIKSPTFTLSGKADVSIWYKNNIIAGTSKVTVYDQADNVVFEFDDFVASGTLGYIEFEVEATVTQLKIVYTKDKGNMAVGSVTVVLQH